MPKIVNEVPTVERPGRAKQHDFTELYKQLLETGKAVELVQGTDFKSSGASMKQYIYRDARENDLKAEVWSEEIDGKPHRVIFSVRKLTAEDKKKAEEAAAKRAATKAAKAEAEANGGTPDGE